MHTWLNPGRSSAIVRFPIAVLLLCVSTSLLTRPTRAVAEPPSGDPWIAQHLDGLVGLYQHLHTHPELSFQEHETAKRIAAELQQAGAEVTPGVGKLGVVGVLKNGPGPVVLVRTDMDCAARRRGNRTLVCQQGQGD